jgi:hypothetical protein
MPSMQRKLMVRKQFQKILLYYPVDVYYTLCREEEKVRLDREVQKKTDYINRSIENEVRGKEKKKRIYQTS